MSTNEFSFYVYYAPPSNLAQLGSRTRKTPTKELQTAMTNFRDYMSGSKAKIEVSEVPSMGGFNVFGIRKATLEKLPKSFHGFTRSDVAEVPRRPLPCKL